MIEDDNIDWIEEYAQKWVEGVIEHTDSFLKVEYAIFNLSKSNPKLCAELIARIAQRAQSDDVLEIFSSGPVDILITRGGDVAKHALQKHAEVVPVLGEILECYL